MKSVRYLSPFVLALLISVSYGDHHLEGVAIEGAWNVVATSDQGEMTLTWTFKNDGKLSGESLNHLDGDTRRFDRISVKKKAVTLEMDIEQDGQKGVIKVEAIEKSKGKLSGEWSIIDSEGTVRMNGKVSATKQVAFAGIWKAESEVPNGNTIQSVVKLSGKNDRLKGTVEGGAGAIEIKKLTAKDNELKINFDLEMNGNTIDVTIEAQPKGDNKLEGRWFVLNENGEEAAEGKWAAERKPTLAGSWSVVATVPNAADYNGELTLTESNGSYSGSSTDSSGVETKFTKVEVKEDKLMFTVPFEQDGYSGTITVNATLQDNGSMKGEWALTDETNGEVAREAWTATRKK